MHKFPLCGEMAPEDERDLIEAVVTCEGNLHDPDFSDRFQSIVSKLKSILYTTNNKQPLKVRKIEPWNSVRVTISIPKEAAQRLRLLAQQGSNVLRQLGILSVQVEGDQVISLTLAGRFNEPQEVILRQSNEPTNSGASPSTASTSICSSSSTASSTSSSVPSPIVPTAGPSGVMVSLDVLSSSSSSAFRSPNVVAPSGELIPFPPKNVPVGPRPPLGGPFPFASMTHAAHTMQRSETTSSSNNNNSTQISSSVTNSTNSIINTNPSSNNANINATTTTVTTHAPAPSPVVIPVSVTSGPHVRNSNSSASSSLLSSSLNTKVNVTVSPSATPPPTPSILTVPTTTLSVRKNSNNNNNLNSPNVNVVSKPQPVLVTAVVNAKNNNNNNSSNSNSGSSSQNNNGSSNISNSSFIPPSNPPNVVVVVNNTNFSKPAPVQGDAKLNPSQHVQHLQHPHHHHSKLQTVLKASTTGVATILSPVLSVKDSKSHENSPKPLPMPSNAATVVAVAGGNPQLTSTGKPRQFLINPLTGHLEPMPSESSSESEGDDEEHVRGGKKHNRVSHLVKSASKGKDNPTVNAAGWEKLSLPPPKPVKITLESLKFNRFIQTTPPPGSAGVLVSRKSSREDSSDPITHPAPLAKENHSVAHHLNNATTPSTNNPVDKIKKLRLKLEKGESLSPASYKMDVTYVKKSEKSSLSTATSSSSSGASSVTMTGQFSTGNHPLSAGNSPGGYHHGSSSSLSSTSSQSPPVSSQTDVPRVPPLHISLRGKNAAVVVSPRRDDSFKDLPSGVLSSNLPSVLSSNSILNEKLIVSVNPSKTSSSTSMAIKRTKIRLKSSDGSSSHGEGSRSGSGSGESKKAGKNFQSRPIVPTQSLSSGTSTSSNLASVNVEEREDPLKARLKSEDKLNSVPSALSEFGKGKSASVSDLISGNPGAISSVNAMSITAAASSLSSSSSSSPSSAATALLPLKVKKHRRKSELVPSSRQVFIPSQSHDREVIRSSNSVAEASQLMKLLSQQVVKEDVGGVFNLPLSHPNPVSTTIPTSVTPISSSPSSMLTAPAVVVVNAVVDSSPISCDNDKDRGRSTNISVAPATSLPPSRLVVGGDTLSTTSATTTLRLPLSPPAVSTAASSSLFTLGNKDNDKNPPKELAGQNPVGKNSSLPTVLVKASDIPNYDQGSQALTNELEITSPTAIPDLKLSKSPYSNKTLPDLRALPLPATVVSNISDACKSEVTASSQSLIFSLSSQIPQPQQQHQLQPKNHPPPTSLPSTSPLVSKDSVTASLVPTSTVGSVSVTKGGGSGVTTTTPTTQSAIVVSRSISELVLPKNSKTSSTSSNSNNNSDNLQKHLQQLHTHSQLVTPPSSSTTSSAANAGSKTATIALTSSKSSLLESSPVQLVGSSILNQMLTGKEVQSESVVCGTGSLNPKTSLSDFPSHLSTDNTRIASNPSPTTPSVLIARVQNSPLRVTTGVSSSSSGRAMGSLDVDSKSSITLKPSIVKLVSGKGPELMEMGSMSKSLEILTSQDRFRHHHLGAGITLNSMDVDVEAKVLNVAVDVKEKEICPKAQQTLHAPTHTQKPTPTPVAVDVVRLEEIKEKVHVSSPSVSLHPNINMNNNKNEPVLESELLIESDREDVHSNISTSNSRSSPATVMAAPNVNVNVSSPSNSHNTLSMDPLPLRLMAMSLPSSSSPSSSLVLATTTVGGNSGSGKPEDHIGSGGVPGEDSGIDSMDALSEKSPNQGESPARKNENDHQFCDNSSTSHQSQHQPLHQPLPHHPQHPHKNSPLSEQQQLSVSPSDSSTSVVSHLQEQEHAPSIPDSSSTVNIISTGSEPSSSGSGDGDSHNIEQPPTLSDQVDLAQSLGYHDDDDDVAPPAMEEDVVVPSDIILSSSANSNDAPEEVLHSNADTTPPSAMMSITVHKDNLNLVPSLEVTTATMEESQRMDTEIRGVTELVKNESEPSPVRNQVPLSLPSASAATVLVAPICSIRSNTCATPTTSPSITIPSTSNTNNTSTLTSQLSLTSPSSAQHDHLDTPQEIESMDTDMVAIKDNDSAYTSTPSTTSPDTEQEKQSSAADATNRTDFDTSIHSDDSVVNNNINGNTNSTVNSCDNNMENIEESIHSELNNVTNSDNGNNDSASEVQLQLQIQPSNNILHPSPSCPSPSLVNGNGMTSTPASDTFSDDNIERAELVMADSSQEPLSTASSSIVSSVTTITPTPEEPVALATTTAVPEGAPTSSDNNLVTVAPTDVPLDSDVEMIDIMEVVQSESVSKISTDVVFEMSTSSRTATSDLASQPVILDLLKPREKSEDATTSHPNNLLVPDNGLIEKIDVQKQLLEEHTPQSPIATVTSAENEFVNMVKSVTPSEFESEIEPSVDKLQTENLVGDSEDTPVKSVDLNPSPTSASAHGKNAADSTSEASVQVTSSSDNEIATSLSVDATKEPESKVTPQSELDAIIPVADSSRSPSPSELALLLPSTSESNSIEMEPPTPVSTVSTFTVTQAKIPVPNPIPAIEADVDKDSESVDKLKSTTVIPAEVKIPDYDVPAHENPSDKVQKEPEEATITIISQSDQLEEAKSSSSVIETESIESATLTDVPVSLELNTPVPMIIDELQISKKPVEPDSKLQVLSDKLETTVVVVENIDSDSMPSDRPLLVPSPPQEDHEQLVENPKIDIVEPQAPEPEMLGLAFEEPLLSLDIVKPEIIQVTHDVKDTTAVVPSPAVVDEIKGIGVTEEIATTGQLDTIKPSETDLEKVVVSSLPLLHQPQVSISVASVSPVAVQCKNVVEPCEAESTDIKVPSTSSVSVPIELTPTIVMEKETVIEPVLEPPPAEKATSINHPVPEHPVVEAIESYPGIVAVVKPTEPEPSTATQAVSVENPGKDRASDVDLSQVKDVPVASTKPPVVITSSPEGTLLVPVPTLEVKKTPENLNQSGILAEVKTKAVYEPQARIPSSESEKVVINADVPVPVTDLPSSVSSVEKTMLREKHQQQTEAQVKLSVASAGKPIAKLKEVEDINKVRIKVDASTSARLTNMAATTPIMYPSKVISSNSNISHIVVKGDEKEKIKERTLPQEAVTQSSLVQAPKQPIITAAVTGTAAPASQEVLNLNSKLHEAKQQSQSEAQQLLQPKITPATASNTSPNPVPPTTVRSSRKVDNIQHPLPILIPAPNQTPRESHSFQSFNVQQGSKPQMPSIAPMHKIKISQEPTEVIHNSQIKTTTTGGAVAATAVPSPTHSVNAHILNATNIDTTPSHPAPTTNADAGTPPLPPILIRPNFQQPIQFTLDSQHKPVSIQQQNLHIQNRQPIEISLPNKMEGKTNLNINVARGVVPNVIQLTKASAVNLTNRMPIAVTASQCHPVTKSSPISVSLSPLTGPAGLGNASGTPTVFAIHPHQYHHHQSAITVLPSGHKMVPIKLVTIPKQNQAQLPLQTMVGSNRSSPTILETVNIVTATSRSASPNAGAIKSKAVVHGNPIQTSPLNLTSVTSGNLHLVPISVASASASGTSSPVKVLVSSPMKMQPNILQSMMVQGQIMMTNQHQNHPATIRVVRPIVSHNREPTKLEAAFSSKQRDREEKTVRFDPSLPSLPPAVVQQPPETAVVVAVEDKNSIYEHLDGVEVLETEDTNEDDLFPFEADIIHDEKDLEDVLADEEKCTVTENGIGLGMLDDPYDMDNNGRCRRKSNHEMMGSNARNISPIDSSAADVDLDKGLDSPIPAMRASSPLYTYSNRSGRNSHSASESRSPSPPEPDVHGEDQEIIDCLSRSPSQPKLSPQNKPLLSLDNDADQDTDYPTKPELHPDHTYVGGKGGGRSENSSTSSTSSSAPQLEQLSIEIPSVDLMAMSPATTEENRSKSTRNTRSNTRLVSPDITAFRSDTPKPTKFTNKPDALILRNSPKPSPTGSLKTHSPGLAAIQPSTSTRASPIPNQLSVNLNSGIHPIAGRNSPNLVASSLGLSGRGGSGGLAGTAFINKRKRQESDSSNASKDENSEENKIDIDLNSRPGKRRCSENAAELIKACIGVEDTPKRNTSLIKKMELQDTKAKDAASGKGKKPIMSVVVEENEDDLESVDLLNRGRGGGRSSRGSSEDRSSSRGSSVHRNTVTSKPNAKESEEHKDSKANSRVNNRAVGTKDMTNKSKVQGSGRDSPNPISNLAKKDDKAQSAVGRRSNRNAPTKEKSPLTLAKTRTNVRKEPVVTGGTEKPTTPSTSPENGNPRRKTRSSVAGMSDSSMPSFKRRRISKDAKS